MMITEKAALSMQSMQSLVEEMVELAAQGESNHSSRRTRTAPAHL